MFNKCAVNALFGGPGRMRKVKCDNRNEEKGHFPCPALGTDVITAAITLSVQYEVQLWATVPESVRVEVDRLQHREDITGVK